MTRKRIAAKPSDWTEDFSLQELAQFEPDPEGVGSTETADTPRGGGNDDPQWVVFPDPADESEWVAADLGW